VSRVVPKDLRAANASEFDDRPLDILSHTIYLSHVDTMCDDRRTN